MGWPKSSSTRNPGYTSTTIPPRLLRLSGGCERTPQLRAVCKRAGKHESRSCSASPRCSTERLNVMRGLLPDSILTFRIVFGALFGLLLGSFLNVCIYRIPRDLSVVWPRSFCPECGQTIKWHENIPLLSFVLLGGRCSSCSQTIGFRYPAVEILTATVFGIIAYKYSFTLVAAKWCIFEALLIALFWTDMEERILPDELTIGGALVGAVLSFFVSVPGFFG